VQCIAFILSMWSVFLCTAPEMNNPDVFFVLQMFRAVSQSVINTGSEGVVGRKWQSDERK